MPTIKNINPELGSQITFTAESIDAAIEKMIAALSICGFVVPIKLEIGKDYEVLIK